MTEEQVWQRNEELQQAMRPTADESDRGITLIIAAHIETCLLRILEAVLLQSKETETFFNGPYAPSGSQSGKIQAAFVMGLITRSKRDRFDAVRGIRYVLLTKRSLRKACRASWRGRVAAARRQGENAG